MNFFIIILFKQAITYNFNCQKYDLQQICKEGDVLELNIPKYCYLSRDVVFDCQTQIKSITIKPLTPSTMFQIMNGKFTVKRSFKITFINAIVRLDQLTLLAQEIYIENVIFSNQQFFFKKELQNDIFNLFINGVNIHFQNVTLLNLNNIDSPIIQVIAENRFVSNNSKFKQNQINNAMMDIQAPFINISNMDIQENLINNTYFLQISLQCQVIEIIFINIQQNYFQNSSFIKTFRINSEKMIMWFLFRLDFNRNILNDGNIVKMQDFLGNLSFNLIQFERNTIIYTKEYVFFDLSQINEVSFFNFRFSQNIFNCLYCIILQIEKCQKVEISKLTYDQNNFRNESEIALFFINKINISEKNQAKSKNEFTENNDFCWQSIIDYQKGYALDVFKGHDIEQFIIKEVEFNNPYSFGWSIVYLTNYYNLLNATISNIKVNQTIGSIIKKELITIEANVKQLAIKDCTFTNFRIYSKPLISIILPSNLPIPSIGNLILHNLLFSDIDIVLTSISDSSTLILFRSKLQGKIMISSITNINLFLYMVNFRIATLKSTYCTSDHFFSILKMEQQIFSFEDSLTNQKELNQLIHESSSVYLIDALRSSVVLINNSLVNVSSTLYWNAIIIKSFNLEILNSIFSFANILEGLDFQTDGGQQFSTFIFIRFLHLHIANKLLIQDCSFTLARAQNGGAIWLNFLLISSIFTLIKTQFIDTSAVNNGGAISISYAQSEEIQFLVSKSTFKFISAKTGLAFQILNSHPKNSQRFEFFDIEISSNQCYNCDGWYLTYESITSNQMPNINFIQQKIDFQEQFIDASYFSLISINNANVKLDTFKITGIIDPFQYLIIIQNSSIVNMKNVILENITNTNSTLIKLHNFLFGMIEDLKVSSILYENSKYLLDFQNFTNFTFKSNQFFNIQCTHYCERILSITNGQVLSIIEVIFKSIIKFGIFFFKNISQIDLSHSQFMNIENNKIESDNGTALKVQNSHINLKNCFFSNLSGAFFGGAIYIFGESKLNFDFDTKFYQSKANYGPQIYEQVCEPNLFNLKEIETVPAGFTISLNQQQLRAYNIKYFNLWKKNLSQIQSENELTNNLLLLKPVFTSYNWLHKMKVYYKNDSDENYYPLNLKCLLKVNNSSYPQESTLDSDNVQTEESEESEDIISNQLIDNFDCDQLTEINENEQLNTRMEKLLKNRFIIYESQDFRLFEGTSTLTLKFDTHLCPKNQYLKMPIQITFNVTFGQCEKGEFKNQKNGCVKCDKIKYSLKNDSSDCITCPYAQAECKNGFIVRLKPNYWRENDETDQIEYCANAPENCEEDFKRNKQCKTGLIGPLCETCDHEDTFYETEKYKCENCSKQLQNLWKYLLQLSIYLTFFLLTMQLSLNAMVKQVQIDYLKKAGFLNLGLTSMISLPAIFIKLFINYLQWITIIQQYSKGLILYFFKYISLFDDPNFVILSISTIQCWINQTAKQHSSKYFFLLIEAEVFLTILLLFAVLLAQWAVQALQRRNLKCTLIGFTINYFFIFLIPNMSYRVLQNMVCRKITTVLYLKSYLKYKCFDEEHSRYFWPGILPEFLILVIVIPFTIMFLLYQERNKQYSIKYRIMYAIFTQEYRLKYYDFFKFYSLIITFILGSVFQKPSSYIILLILLFYSQTREFTKPYLFKSVQSYDAISSFSIMLTLILVMILEDFQTSLVVLQGLIIVIIISLHLLYIMKFFIKISYTYQRLYGDRITSLLLFTLFRRVCCQNLSINSSSSKKKALHRWLKIKFLFQKEFRIKKQRLKEQIEEEELELTEQDEFKQNCLTEPQPEYNQEVENQNSYTYSAPNYTKLLEELQQVEGDQNSESKFIEISNYDLGYQPNYEKILNNEDYQQLKNEEDHLINNSEKY